VPQADRIKVASTTMLIASIKRFLDMSFSSYREIEFLLGFLGKYRSVSHLFVQPPPSLR
jgi:hypothetical protein